MAALGEKDEETESTATSSTLPTTTVQSVSSNPVSKGVAVPPPTTLVSTIVQIVILVVGLSIFYSIPQTKTAPIAPPVPPFASAPGQLPFGISPAHNPFSLNVLPGFPPIAPGPMIGQPPIPPMPPMPPGLWPATSVTPPGMSTCRYYRRRYLW